MISFRTTVAAFVVGTFAIAGTTLGQIQDDAKAVLIRSAEAIKNFKDISGTTRRYTTGPLLGGMIDIGGDFKLIRGADKSRSPSFFKGVAKSVANPNEDRFHFTLAIEGGQQTVTWADDVAKVVFTRPLVVRTEAFNQLNLGQQLLLDEYFDAEPFRKELNAQSLTLEADDMFGGEPCTVVRATYKNGETWGVWYISKNDNLPRKSDMGIKLEGYEEPVHVYVELTNVKANQNLTAKDLALTVPEGYREDKQLAALPTADPTAAPVVVPPPPTLGPDRAASAPEFDLKTPAGDTVSLNGLRGNVVVLAFWGTWNGASTRALPVLEAVNRKFAGKSVKIFAASCREKDEAAPAAMLAEKGFTYGLLLEADEVAKAYKVRGFPSFAVIDPAGNIGEFIQGFRNDDDLSQRLTAAINAALGEE